MTKHNGHDDPKIADFLEEQERKAIEKAHIVHHAAENKEPAFNLPPVTQALCLLNIGVFLLGKLFPSLMTDENMYALSFVPARYFGAEPMGAAGLFSPVTHMFLHAGWAHLLINVATLMAFGAGLEKMMGLRRFLLFYFTTGLCAALAQALADPHMEAPMIGASGAISGLFGGILMMMYAGGFMGRGYRKLLPFVFIWIGISVFFGLFGIPGVDNPIAWVTHIGGFIAGLLLYKPILRLKVQH
jgi:membrane associated rhomboid family serine protease